MNFYSPGSNVLMEFLTYLGNLFHGNLGSMSSSFYTGGVLKGILLYFPTTVEIAVGTVLLTLIIAIPISTFIGMRPNSPSDFSLRTLSLLLYAIPIFWLGFIIEFLFGYNIGILPKLLGNNVGLPLYGQGFPVNGTVPWIQNNVSNPTHMLLIDSLLHGDFTLAYIAFLHLIMPVLLLTLGLLAIIFRYMRSGIMDSVDKLYVKAARARGVDHAALIKRHILKNGLLPSSTVIGLIVAFLLGGTLVVEQFFKINGIGLLVLGAIGNGTVSHLQIYGVVGIILLFGLTFLITNLIVDIVYSLIDPRIKY
jgi:peptide/nickel transport system permease protein